MQSSSGEEGFSRNEDKFYKFNKTIGFKERGLLSLPSNATCVPAQR